MKRHAINWKKRSAIHMSDRGPIARIYKEHIQVNNNKTNKMAKGLEQTLCKRRYRDGPKAHERCLKSLVLGKQPLRPQWDTTTYILTKILKQQLACTKWCWECRATGPLRQRETFMKHPIAYPKEDSHAHSAGEETAAIRGSDPHPRPQGLRWGWDWSQDSLSPTLPPLN